MFSRVIESPLRRIFVAFIVFIFTQHVYAVTVTTSGIPSTVDKDQELDVEVQLICSGCQDSYLRGVFFASGDNYFGFTKNNKGDWISTTSDKTQYYNIAENELTEGSWSGKLRVKPDSSSSYYTEPKTYSFKVGRYTAGGSVTWSNGTGINITGALPTPSPTSTPVPTATPTYTPSSSPTSSPQNTSTPIKGITPTKTKTPTPKIFPSPTLSERKSDDSSVFGAVNSPTPTSEQVAASGSSSLLPVIISLSFVSAGLALLSLLFIWKRRNALHQEKRVEDGILNP